MNYSVSVSDEVQRGEMEMVSSSFCVWRLGAVGLVGSVGSDVGVVCSVVGSGVGVGVGVDFLLLVASLRRSCSSCLTWASMLMCWWRSEVAAAHCCLVLGSASARMARVRSAVSSGEVMMAPAVAGMMGSRRWLSTEPGSMRGE